MRDSPLAPVHAAALILCAGAAAWASSSPWLFPSLGPTAVLLATHPDSVEARPWSVFAGHAAGVVAALAAVWLCGSRVSPAALGAAGPDLRQALAAALAVGGTLWLGRLLRAPHPPAAATTLILALGALPPTITGGGWIGVGVVLLLIIDTAGKRLARRAHNW